MVVCIYHKKTSKTGFQSCGGVIVCHKNQHTQKGAKRPKTQARSLMGGQKNKLQKTVKTISRLNAAIPQVAAVHLKLVILHFAQIQIRGRINILVGVVADDAERVAVNLLQTLNPQLVHLTEQVDALARIARSHLPKHRAAVGERGVHAVAFDAGAKAMRWHRRHIISRILPNRTILQRIGRQQPRRSTECRPRSCPYPRPYRMGAAVAHAGGNNALAGALAAGEPEAAAPIISHDLYQERDGSRLSAAQKETVTAIASLLGTAAGAALGNTPANAAQGEFECAQCGRK